MNKQEYEDLIKKVPDFPKPCMITSGAPSNPLRLAEYVRFHFREELSYRCRATTPTPQKTNVNLELFTVLGPPYGVA